MEYVGNCVGMKYFGNHVGMKYCPQGISQDKDVLAAILKNAFSGKTGARLAAGAGQRRVSSSSEACSATVLKCIEQKGRFKDGLAVIPQCS